MREQKSDYEREEQVINEQQWTNFPKCSEEMAKNALDPGFKK